MISPDTGAPSEFAETIRKIFSPDGLLSEAKSFEYRPEQTKRRGRNDSYSAAAPMKISLTFPDFRVKMTPP